MDSRETFEKKLNQAIAYRLDQTKASESETLWMVDMFCAATMMCARALGIESPAAAFQMVMGRMEKMRDMIEQGRGKKQGPSEGEPTTAENQPKLVDFTPKGGSRIIRP